MQKQRFIALATICLGLCAVGLAAAQQTTTIGNLPTNPNPSPGYYTVVDDGSAHTWKASLLSILQVVTGIPVTVANGGTGTNAPNPTATSTGCGTLAYGGPAWPNQQLQGNFVACGTPQPIYSGACTSPRPTGGGVAIDVVTPCPGLPTPQPPDGANYIPTMKTYASLTHFWEWTNPDSNCPGLIHDAVGDGGWATAAPAPTPLPSFTPNPQPTAPATLPPPLCGQKGVINDGNSATLVTERFDGGNTVPGYGWNWPTAVQPRTSAFSIEAVFNPMNLIYNDSLQTYIFMTGTGASFQGMFINQGQLNVACGASQQAFGMLSTGPTIVDFTYDGTTVTAYLNGVMGYRGACTPTDPTTNVGWVYGGNGQINGARGFGGRAMYFAQFNTALTPAQVAADYLASGIR